MTPKIKRYDVEKDEIRRIVELYISTLYDREYYSLEAEWGEEGNLIIRDADVELSVEEDEDEYQEDVDVDEDSRYWEHARKWDSEKVKATVEAIAPKPKLSTHMAEAVARASEQFRREYTARPAPEEKGFVPYECGNCGGTEYTKPAHYVCSECGHCQYGKQE